MLPAPPPIADFDRLLQAARSGCQESLGRLLEECRPSLLPVAGKRLGGELRAAVGESDVAQDALLRAALAFGTFRGQSWPELLGWLRRIALNCLADAAARQHRRPALPLGDHDPRADESTASARLIRGERSEALSRALARLPDDQRRVVLLCHRQNLTWAEIGEQLGRSADAARVLYGRAIKHLTQFMRPADDSC